jgi:hypothetical protein
MDESLPMSAAMSRLPLNSRAALRLLATLALSLVVAPSALAGDIHGRIAVGDLAAFNDAESLDALLGYRNRNDFTGNLRLTWERTLGAWDFSAHYVVSADVGEGVALANAFATTPYYSAPPPSTWLDLSGTLISGTDTLVTHRIDRLALGYTAPHVVARVGRQALTWGSGLVFRPMDLVDPFAPNATDTEYKPGVDMAYFQALFDDGSDLQAIAVPRPAVAGGPLTWDASSFALHYSRAIGALQTTWLVARDHGDWVAGLGLSGPLGGAVWNVEIVPTFEMAGPTRISALANISGATTLFGRNATLFAEYFHNGFGAAGGALDSLPSDLADRLARGQVFNTGRDYVAGGMTLEVTPLLSVSPTLIVNLNDWSFDAAVEAKRSLSDNLDLIAGANVPFGPDGTEYGGLPITGGATTYATPAATAYAELRRYF